MTSRPRIDGSTSLKTWETRVKANSAPTPKTATTEVSETSLAIQDCPEPVRDKSGELRFKFELEVGGRFKVGVPIFIGRNPFSKRRRNVDLEPVMIRLLGGDLKLILVGEDVALKLLVIDDHDGHAENPLTVRCQAVAMCWP